MPAQIVQEYVVLGKRQETPTVTTLILALPSSDVPSYKAGQYITVYFRDSSIPRGKEYSISSAPFEQTFTISVKATGEYSNRLCALQCGDTFLGSPPRGTFYSERDDTDLVMLAAGIGITPFRSIIFDAIQRTSTQELYLFYSNPTVQENLFIREFEMLTKRNERFHLQTYVTRESLTTPIALVRHITQENILRTIHSTTYSEFLISGTTSFVREQRVGLENAGFLHERIYTEVCT
jgi:ferredoxin-NADP reductase